MNDELFHVDTSTKVTPEPRFAPPREGDLVYRNTNPGRIGRVWDDEVDKGAVYVEWLNPSTLQVVPVVDLVVVTPEEQT